MRDPSSNPYVGARPFERDDKEFFFGRDEEARQLSSLVIAHRVVLFYAQSGAGKTSLLKAQVIPDLEERRHVRVLPVGRVGGDLPRELDSGRIGNIYIFNVLVSLAGMDARQDELAGLNLTEGLVPYMAQAPDEEHLRPRLLILDQFEELFTSHPGRVDERADFFLQIQQCLEAYAHLTLLIAMREDYIANLDFYAAQVPDRLRTRFRMELLNRGGALAAVQRPVGAVKGPDGQPICEFPDEVAEALVDNLSRVQPGHSQEGGPLPVPTTGQYVEPVHLQIVCRQLWANLPPERKAIELQDVQTFGDVDAALAGFYEDALQEVFKAVPVGQRRLRLWVDRNLITPARTRSLVYQGETETAGLPNAAVKVLYDEYIIRPIARGNDLWYELAHDRLVEPILEANRQWRAERSSGRPPVAGAAPVSNQTGDDAGAVVAAAAAAEPPPVSDLAADYGNPYRGLRPFQSGERLYGREREAASLLDLLITERVVLLYSPAGAGKSSLINAAIIPELEREGFRILGPLRAGLELPSGALDRASGSEAPNRYIVSLLLSLENTRSPDAQIDLEGLACMSLADYLRSYPKRPAGCQGDVWIFDQLEEIVTVDQTDFAGKTEFFRQVGLVLSTPGQWALFTLREEFIAGLDAYLQFIPGGLSTRFRLEPLSERSAYEYISQVAANAGVVFTSEAVAMLVDELRTIRVRRADGSVEQRKGPYLEPLQLQLVCTRLWQTLPAGCRTINVEEICALGNLDDIFGRYYDEAIERASQSSGVSQHRIRDWIGRQLITDTGDRARVLHGPEESQGLTNAAVSSLLTDYLLRSEAAGGAIWHELANNRMIAPVRESNKVWFEANANPVQKERIRWEQKDRSDEALLLGKELARAELWASDHREELDAHDMEFLALSHQAQAAVEHRYRLAKRLQWLTMALTVSLFVAFVFIELTLMQRRAVEDAISVAMAQREMAMAQQKTAEIARAEAVADRATAQAASTAAVQALQALEANLKAGLTSQAFPSDTPTQAITPLPALVSTLTPTVMPSAAPSATGTIEAGSLPIRMPTPTAALEPTGTTQPSPTPNRTIVAQQTQLAQVRATQTALAAVPPQGRILFVSNRNSPQDLYVVKPDGSGLEQRTYFLAQEPSYTPGQQLIAFTKLRVGGTPESIYVAPVDGTDEQLVTKPDDWDYWEPSISPDGSQIAASSSHGNVNAEIFVVDLGGRVIRQLTNWNPAKSETPSWSPDGQYVAFASDHEGNREIYLVKADGSGEPVRLTDNAADDSYPAWSPDSRTIAFISDRDGNRDVWLMDRNGQNLVNLTRSPEEEKYPAWSLDGNWLAFTRTPPNQQSSQEVFLMRADGTQVQNLTQNPAAEDFQPVWIP